MCEHCNGTHVVHEMNSYGYRTNCCPICGPELKEIRNERLDKIIAWAEQMKREAKHDHH